MTEPGAETKFASWSTSRVPLEIEYSLTVMAEIQAALSAATLETPELETGGVFFGRQIHGAIRIETWRPMTCQHSEGPALRLSGRDRVELACLLELARRSPDLRDLQPLGWFVSHPRTGVSLSASDLEIYNGFFPYAWQVTLALQPLTRGKTRAGFFVREPDGSVHSASSYLEFEIESVDLPPPVETPSIFSWADPARSSESKADSNLPATPASSSPVLSRSLDISSPPSAMDAHGPTLWSRLRRPVTWLWAVAILMVVSVAGLLLKQKSPPHFEPFSLRVSDSQQTLQVEWDRNLPLLREARAAVFDIRDGGKSTRYALSPDEIRAGSMSYVRQSGDVNLVMTVYPPSGPAVQGFGKLLAPPSASANKPPNSVPSANASDMAELRAERDALRAEVAHLEDQLRKEAAEKNRLQDLTRILENRLNLAAPPTSAAGAKQNQ